jgi:hypothetical protein
MQGAFEGALIYGFLHGDLAVDIGAFADGDMRSANFAGDTAAYLHRASASGRLRGGEVLIMGATLANE